MKKRYLCVKSDDPKAISDPYNWGIIHEDDIEEQHWTIYDGNPSRIPYPVMKAVELIEKEFHQSVSRPIMFGDKQRRTR